MNDKRNETSDEQAAAPQSQPGPEAAEIRNGEIPPERSAENGGEDSAGEPESLPASGAESADSDTTATMDDVARDLAALRQLLEEKMKATATCCSQSAFDRLHEEMQQYKEKNFIHKLREGLLYDLLLLYDNIERLKEHYQGSEPIDAARLRDNLSGLLSETEEIFARCGIELLTETSERLNPHTQRPIRSEPTTDPDQDKRVVRRVKAGFWFSGEEENPSLFRKEDVVILKYTPEVGDAEKESAESE